MPSKGAVRCVLIQSLPDVKAGEDEGSIEFEVLNASGNHVVSANLLVSGELTATPLFLNIEGAIQIRQNIRIIIHSTRFRRAQMCPTMLPRFSRTFPRARRV